MLLKQLLSISLSTGSYIIYDYYSYWYILHIALHIVIYTENLDRLFYEGLQIFFQIHSFPSSFCNWCLRCPLHPVIIDSFKALKLYRLLCCRVCKSIYRWVSTYCLSEHSWLRSCSKDAELCASVLNYSNSYNRDSKERI